MVYTGVYKFEICLKQFPFDLINGNLILVDGRSRYLTVYLFNHNTA